MVHIRLVLKFFMSVILALFLLTLFKLMNQSPKHQWFSTVIVDHNINTHYLNKLDTNLMPVVLVAIQIRNHSYALPTFLKTLESLDCQSKRCDLLVTFDKSSDGSFEIFKYWLDHTRSNFNTVKIDKTNDPETNQKTLKDLYKSSNNLKIRAISYAIRNNFSAIFFIAPNIILTDSKVINKVINLGSQVIAPFLTSVEGEFSNFDTQSKKKFSNYYKQEIFGILPVNFVRECYLIKLTNEVVKSLLENNIYYTGYYEDSEINSSLNNSGIEKVLFNPQIFGYITDMHIDQDYIGKEEDNFIMLRMDHLSKGGLFNDPLPVSQFINAPEIKKKNFGFDQINIINLERRPERKRRIVSIMNDLNIEARIFKASDGRMLKEKDIKALNISVIPEIKMNYGEVACFLSHYTLWNEMVKKNYKKTLIFEDDVKFDKKFNRVLEHVMSQMNEKYPDWDLIFLGRIPKRIQKENSTKYIESKYGHNVIKPSHTWGLFGYALSHKGAKKLIDSQPLSKLVSADEYLSIMFDEHPNSQKSSYFPKRDLNAFAVDPIIVTQSYQFRQKGYRSDTTSSHLLGMT